MTNEKTGRHCDFPNDACDIRWWPIDPEEIMIPPLLIQPFVENSIWHGLSHRQKNGELSVSITLDGSFLNCRITDNGIGRAQAAILSDRSHTKGKSFGLKITSERMALFNKDYAQTNTYQIADILDESGNCKGTTVELHIFCQQTTAIVTA